MSGEDSGDGPLGFGDPDDAEVTPEHERADPVEEGPPQSYQPRGTPVNTAKYTWFVGIAALVLIAYVFISGVLGNNGPGSRGVKVGRVIPPFAAPLAIGGEVGDVNVARKPHDGSAGKVPACSIHSTTVLTVCDAYARRPLVLAFFATRGSQCTSELDTIEAVSARFPQIAVAAVAIRGDLGDLRKLVTKHRWTFPVAYDRDGVLANLFSVAICPQITYVRRGGRAAGTTLGQLNEAALAKRFAALAAGHLVPR